MNDKLPSLPPGKAALFTRPDSPFEFVSRSVPPSKPGEILVKNLYTTLCGSDLHTFSGRRVEPPRVVLGHEIVGDILRIDPGHNARDLRGQPVQVGDRITWSIFSVPENVMAPRPDIPQKSDLLYKYGHALAQGNEVFNGGLADYCILRPYTALIKISKSIPLPVAATINCAHSTVMGAVRIAGGDLEGKRILIFGAGLLGLSCVAMCREGGASWIGLVDPDFKRLQWGQKFGSDQGYPVNGLSRGSALPWPQVHLVFDMTGNPQAMEGGLDSLDVGGIAVWIGAVFPERPVAVDAQQLVRRLGQIRGLHNYNYEDFLNATAFIEKNYQKFPFEDVIEKEFPLDQVDQAFAFASEHKPVRVGIRI
jgi:putative phosphonate catabolism associated alcohol dehydrogenase